MGKFKFYDVTVEQELRYTIPLEQLRAAFENGYLKVLNVVHIDQTWFGSDDKYTARIRKTTQNLPVFADASALYEQTVKHHVRKGVDYEVTTPLQKNDYELLLDLYKDKTHQSKSRMFLRLTDSKYNDKYYITADVMDDKPDECVVEFELQQEALDNKEQFVKPEWLEENFNEGR